MRAPRYLVITPPGASGMRRPSSSSHPRARASSCSLGPAARCARPCTLTLTLALMRMSGSVRHSSSPPLLKTPHHKRSDQSTFLLMNEWGLDDLIFVSSSPFRIIQSPAEQCSSSAEMTYWLAVPLPLRERTTGSHVFCTALPRHSSANCHSHCESEPQARTCSAPRFFASTPGRTSE